MTESPNTPAFLYFIRVEHTIFVKIGFSKNVEARRRDLQTALPFLLVTEHTLTISSERSRDVERGFHKRWRHRRCHSEWFEIGESELARFVANEARALVEQIEKAAPPAPTPLPIDTTPIDRLLDRLGEGPISAGPQIF